MFELWALDETAFQSLMEMYKNPELVANTAKLALERIQGGMSKPLFIEDGAAIIPVKGILEKEPQGGLTSLLFGGGSSYLEISAAIIEANENADVDRIILDVDSPGGAVNGMFNTAQVIKESAKPVIAEISGIAFSAAYTLISQAKEIRSSNEADRVGSIGTRVSMFTSENVIVVTSTNAPFKAPDPKTQEGIDAIKTELDMVANLMVKTIAEGRDTNPETVNRDFGKGMTLTSDIAIQRGMIDAIEDKITSSGFNDPMLAASPGFQDFEIVDIPFNARQSRRMVREATGSGETPSKEFRQAFFWYDSKNASKFESYKLPFTSISDGKLIAVRSAIISANSAMKGKRKEEIPEADREAVQKHINKYMAKIAKLDKTKNKSTTGGTGMDLQAVYGENPEVRKEVEGLVADAVKAAVGGERDRVVAHLNNIAHSPETVVKAITEGTEFSQAVQSEYMNAMHKVATGQKTVKDNPGKVIAGGGDDDDPAAKEAAMGGVLDTLLAAGSKE